MWRWIVVSAVLMALGLGAVGLYARNNPPQERVCNTTDQWGFNTCTKYDKTSLGDQRSDYWFFGAGAVLVLAGLIIVVTRPRRQRLGEQ